MPPTSEQRRKLKKAIERFDLEAYIEATFDKVIPSGSSELRVDCFSPEGCSGGDTKAHLWINIHKKAWICYKCGYGDHDVQKGTGWIPRFIADAEGLPLHLAIRRVLDVADPTPEENLEELLNRLFDGDEESVEDEEPPVMKMPRQFHRLSEARGISSKKFHEYAKSRGFTQDLIHEHDIRYCVSPILSLPQKYRSTFVDRIVWPVYDSENVLRSAVARDVTGRSNRPKWVNWPDTEPSWFLWPMGGYDEDRDWLPTPLEETVVLTEGIINAYAVEKLTPYAARACFGKKISNEQIDLLLNGGVKEVILAWDFDAKDKMIKAQRRLSPMFEVKLFPYRHPAWQTNLDFGDALDKNSPVHQFVVQEMRNAICPQSGEYIRWAMQR